LVSVALVGVSNLNQYCHSFGVGISGRVFVSSRGGRRSWGEWRPP
jgi:hypothetical protein